MDRLAVEARLAAKRTSETRQVLNETTERLDRREKEIEREARKKVEEYLLSARGAVEEEVERLRQTAVPVSRDSSGEPAVLDTAVREARAGVERLLREVRKPGDDGSRSRARRSWPAPGG